MFEWINKQGVSSDEGYVFQRIHRYFYNYVENGRILRIDVEPGMKVEEIILDSRQWDPPFENIPISDEEFSQIRKRVEDALRFMRIRYSLRGSHGA